MECERARMLTTRTSPRGYELARDHDDNRTSWINRHTGSLQVVYRLFIPESSLNVHSNAT